MIRPPKNGHEAYSPMEWEYNHLPLHRCMHCQRPIEGTPFFVEKFFGKESVKLPFCNRVHHEGWYLANLRANGL